MHSDIAATHIKQANLAAVTQSNGFNRLMSFIKKLIANANNIIGAIANIIKTLNSLSILSFLIGLFII
tara:strand:- start:364 stop:567 length:204 start_codon:yes stop_codon:yes gene_type:complete